jgi:predicted nucleic acid-binding protein
MILVLDTSVLVKWFKQEKDSDKALEVREAFFNEEVDIAVPDLVFYELANVMRYDDGFKIKMINQAIESLREMDFQIVAPYSDFMDRIVGNASELDLTVYDSAFYTLAEISGGTLVTVDNELHDKTDDSVLLEDVKLPTD